MFDSLKTRAEVLERLRAVLPGRNLYHLAREFDVPIVVGGKQNKGWVGQTLERAGGLSINSRAGTDGADFELKSTTLIPRDGSWVPRETIKVTQFSPDTILQETFEDSQLWKKLRRLILIGYVHPQPGEAEVIRINSIDVVDEALIEKLRDYWEETREILVTGEMAVYNSQGSSGGYLQLRPIGKVSNSSRCPITGELFQAKAFYATKPLVRALLQL